MEDLIDYASICRVKKIIRPTSRRFSRESKHRRLGEPNSRMKDFYDLHLFASSVDVTGEILAEAIQKTFAVRNTAIPKELGSLVQQG